MTSVHATPNQQNLLKMKIKTVGVVGAGIMGSALAQKYAQEGFEVILADREMQYVEKGLAAIRSTLEQGVERRLFRPEQLEGFISKIKGTADLKDLRGCDLVVEAIFENFEAKEGLFKNLNGILRKDAILATNTSSFSVTELAACVSHPERFIGMHYFFHAAKNRLVEIIPGAQTSIATIKAMQIFAVQSGKDAIFCKDANGFVVNRFFVPWLNESVRILKEGIADAATIDFVARKTFGIGMGPFVLMNATGVPVAYHAQKTLEVFGDFYRAAEKLAAQAERKLPWEIGEIQPQEVDAAIEKEVRERLLAVVFFVCAQILDEKICSATDLNRGAKIGLRWKRGPVDLMKKLGAEEVRRLVGKVTAKYKVRQPFSLIEHYWKMEFVTLEKRGKQAIITMSRPEEMNALDEKVMQQLNEKFTAADADPAIETIFITGAGKAFVAGADIKFFVQNMRKKTLDNIVGFTKFGQSVFEKIDLSAKKVVAVLNGLALGGGVELALCADVILAVPKAKIAFPETGIGIYPGLGGTQRTALRIGKGLAKYLILTGKMLSAAEALEMGLIDGIVQIEEMFALFEGKKAVPKFRRKELSDKWKAISNLFQNNHHKAILEGSCHNGNISQEVVQKLAKAIHHKAPLALEISEQLIEEAKGPQSELEKLVRIFSSSDALLGLSSIGKRVKFEGK